MAIPGEFILADDPIEINSGRRTVTLTVRNTGDRAAQIGSHFHFFEVNRALDFDRPKAMGMHLNIPAGTSVRFEPGQEHEVELVEYAGSKRAVGFNALTMGSVTATWNVKAAIDKANRLEFRSTPEPEMEAEVAAAKTAAAKPAATTTPASIASATGKSTTDDTGKGAN